MNNNELSLILYNMQRQYPSGISTWNICPTKDCEHSARGYEECIYCQTKKLGVQIGNPTLAADYHEALETLNTIKNDILEVIDEEV